LSAFHNLNFSYIILSFTRTILKNSNVKKSLCTQLVNESNALSLLLSYRKLLFYCLTSHKLYCNANLIIYSQQWGVCLGYEHKVLLHFCIQLGGSLIFFPFPLPHYLTLVMSLIVINFLRFLVFSFLFVETLN